MSHENTFNILSLSGGGVRGIFQAHLLAILEEELGQPLSHSFDLCAGTSIGSVLAAAVAANIPARELITHFENAIKRVFGISKARLYQKVIFSSGPLFDRSKLDDVIVPLFGNKKLDELTTDFMCTAGELATFNHRIFSTVDNSRHQNEMLVRDAVLASCSAPIYFSPYELRSAAESFVDGGIWANSPTLIAIHTAHFKLGVPLKDIRIFSIGTGHAPHGSHKSELEKAKLLGFDTALMILNMFSSSNVDFHDETARNLIGHHNFLSVNPVLKDQIQLHNYKSAAKLLPPLAASEAARILETHKKFFTPKEKYTLQAQPSIDPAMSEMINISGLTRIMSDRSRYKDFRDDAGNIEAYLRSAKSSIEMVSINLTTGLGLESISRVFKDKLEENANFHVVVSLLNPEEEHLMKTVTSSISQEYLNKSPEDFADDIRSSLNALLSARDDLSAECKERFDIRVHSALPQGSAIILDRGLDNSVIQIETKPYQAPLSDSYAIEVQSTGKKGLYETFLKAYSTLMEDGDTIIK